MKLGEDQLYVLASALQTRKSVIQMRMQELTGIFAKATQKALMKELRDVETLQTLIEAELRERKHNDGNY